MTHYVVCLVFDGPKEFVVLIEKKRPEWQIGLLNGPGGKVEGEETIYQAASREFLEETGVEIKPEAWRNFHTLECSNGALVDFLTVSRPCNVRTTTDEPVSWYNIAGVGGGDLPLIPNLRWIIPMALDPSHSMSVSHDNPLKTK